jgi:two-component system uhpT operon response regulator UhpA
MPGVLICDDAVAFSVLFGRWMRDCGVELVGHAKTAEEAVAMAVEHRPAVIVVDHLLPDASSAELVPRLREAAPDARLLLISSLPGRDLETAAEVTHADGHISKAVAADEMCAAVRALLG